jgi:RsiW-degrading membrane proteinase PrsW (M82 family)
MAQYRDLPLSQDLPGDRNDWLYVLLLGLSLFFITTLVMFLTRNTNLYPTVILIGNFLMPVVFVTFLYSHRPASALSAATIAQSFFLGGLLGVLGASLLEPLLIPIDPEQGLSLPAALAVGLVEEGCKLLAMLWLARRLRVASQMDGLLLGAAVGMGFAALESTGYAFTAFLLSQGMIGASLFVTILRGLLAPFTHGVWSAILGASLFRNSPPGHVRITGPAFLTYLFVSLLHGLWDGLPSIGYIVIPPGIPISLTALIIGITGLAVLAWMYRQAARQALPPLTPVKASRF